MRRFANLLLAIAALPGLYSCSAGPTSTPAASADAQTPVRGDWAIIRYDAEPESLNRILSTTANADYAINGVNGSQIGETLISYDLSTFRFTAPRLAVAEPVVSPDHLTYTYKLRQGVKWHDGKPFVAADVLFSTKALMCAYVDAGGLRSLFTELADAEIVNDDEVKFTVKKPFFMHENILGGDLPILPRHVFDPTGMLDGFTVSEIIGSRRQDPALQRFGEEFKKHPANRAPVGTGPFKFVRWDSGREIVLARNDDYWGEKPHLDGIVLRFMPDSTAALTALKAGEVDMNPRLLGVQYAQQTSGPDFEDRFVKATYAIPAYTYAVWNIDAKPFFADKRVRRAMTMLTPRDQIVERVRFGLGTVADSHFSSGNPDHHPNLPPIHYDPAGAAKLLDEAGWKDSDGDGIRDKSGVAFRFEMVGSTPNPTTDQLMSIFKDELRKVGIEMSERKLDFAVLTNTLRDRKFDAAVGAWSSGLVTDPYQLWHSSQAVVGKQNYGNYRNPAADTLIESARLEFDDTKRRELYLKWQEIIHDDQPYTFLYYPREASAYARRLASVKWLPMRPGYDVTQWFVPKGSQRFQEPPSR